MSNQIGVLRSYIVTAFAIGLAAVGVAFLFAPQEMGVRVFGRNDVEPMGSLLGGALIGFGLMAWIARKSALGGIYGRTVVAGQQAQFMIGALTLIKHGVAVGGSGTYWVIAAFYAIGAVYFTYLLFGPGVRPPS